MGGPSAGAAGHTPRAVAWLVVSVAHCGRGGKVWRGVCSQRGPRAAHTRSARSGQAVAAWRPPPPTPPKSVKRRPACDTVGEPPLSPTLLCRPFYSGAGLPQWVVTRRGSLGGAAGGGGGGGTPRCSVGEGQLAAMGPAALRGHVGLACHKALLYFIAGVGPVQARPRRAGTRARDWTASRVWPERRRQDAPRRPAAAQRHTFPACVARQRPWGQARNRILPGRSPTSPQLLSVRHARWPRWHRP